MKIVDFDESNCRMRLVAEDEEDIYSIYLILKPGDIVGSRSSRKLKAEEGGSRSGRKSVYLEVASEKFEFYGFGDGIRVSGKITYSSEPSISLSSYHSHRIVQRREISIKSSTCAHWKQLLDQGVGGKRRFIAIAVDDESGIVYLVGERATRVLLELNPTISRKSGDSSQHDADLISMFDSILVFVEDYLSLNEIDHIAIIGPGFTPDKLHNHLKRSPKLFKLARIHQTRAAGRSALQEYLSARDEMRAGFEVSLIQRIMELLSSSTDLVSYGQEHIERAVETGAIETLVVVDAKLHESLEIREWLDSIIRKVRDYGGRVEYVSSLHPSSELLQGFGGVVAILRFPVPD